MKRRTWIEMILLSLIIVCWLNETKMFSQLNVSMLIPQWQVSHNSLDLFSSENSLFLPGSSVLTHSSLVK